jgi:hypothetical protein
MDDASILRCGEHRSRFTDVACEGLLAQDVVTSGDRLERELGVRMWWRGDGDGIDAGQGKGVGQTGHRPLDLEELRALCRSLWVAPDERDDVEPCGAQRAHMGDATEPRADDDRAEGH